MDLDPVCEPIEVEWTWPRFTFEFLYRRKAESRGAAFVPAMALMMCVAIGRRRGIGRIPQRVYMYCGCQSKNFKTVPEDRAKWAGSLSVKT
jgi:hypothetical protein